VKAQVFPRLQLGVRWIGKEWQFVASNVGVGPADIRRIRLTVDGQRMTSWFAAEKALMSGGPTDIGAIGETLTMVPGGATIAPFTVGDREIARMMFVERSRLGVELCYCSTLGDCWTVAGSGVENGLPAPAQDCAPDGVRFQKFDEKALEEYMHSLALPDGGAAHDAGNE
ncbi:MAG TPA: hypothetical protein VGI39_36995, partial [Polyangiaceae bacterium]